MLKDEMTYEELCEYIVSAGADLLRFGWGFVVDDWRRGDYHKYYRSGGVQITCFRRST